jgi:Tol biopolymer transport system component
MMKKLGLALLMLIIMVSNIKIYADDTCTSYIAFDANGFIDSQTNNSNVYLADVNNIPNIIQISSFEEDTFTDWSPDGHQIAFNSNYNNPNIFIYDVVTKTTTPFLEGQDNFIFTFRWSPDGQKIAYVTSNDDYNHIQHLYLYDIATQTTRNLTPMLDSHARNIYWNPNSQIISLFVGISTFETQIIDIENADIPPIRFENSVGFDWYPNGDRLILTLWDEEIPSHYTYNIETGETEDLSEDMIGDWSFDRRYVAYYEGEDIYIKNTQTDEIEVLRSGLAEGQVKDIEWSPYSSEIVFFETDPYGTDSSHGGYIYIKNVETGDIRNVLGDRGLLEPLAPLGWSPCIPPIDE